IADSYRSGGRPGRAWRIRPFCPSLLICFIMRDISWCCFKRRLTSGTLVPDPAAMRCLRDALMSSGRRRSSLVIDDRIACRGVSLFSSTRAPARGGGVEPPAAACLAADAVVVGGAAGGGPHQKGAPAARVAVDAGEH